MRTHLADGADHILAAQLEHFGLVWGWRGRVGGGGEGSGRGTEMEGLACAEAGRELSTPNQRSFGVCVAGPAYFAASSS